MKERDRQKLEARRQEGYGLLQQAVGVSEVARRLGVTPAAVSKWKKLAARRGAAALESKGPPGPRPRLRPAQQQWLGRALLEGAVAHGWTNDLWTLPRVAQLVRQRLGVRYHAGHVSRLLARLGFSCQRPTRRARERDEAAIRRWQRDTWPALKKKPG